MASINWLTLDKISGSGSQSVSISAPDYKGRNNRTLTLTYGPTVAGLVSSKTQTVIQAGKAAFVTLSPNSYSVSNEAGGQVVISGTSNCMRLAFSKTSGDSDLVLPTKYNVNNVDINNDGATCITGDPGQSGGYNFTITFTGIPANTGVSSRQWVIQVQGVVEEEGQDATTVSTTCTITQAAGSATLTISPTELQFDATGGTQTVTVTSNTSWTIS